MKRILLAIIIAVVAVVGLSAGLAHAAPTDVPADAELAPLSASLSPSRQMTATTFTVRCGATAVEGPCEAQCDSFVGESTTFMSAWHVSSTGTSTGTGVVTGTGVSDLLYFTGTATVMREDSDCVTEFDQDEYVIQTESSFYYPGGHGGWGYNEFHYPVHWDITPTDILSQVVVSLSCYEKADYRSLGYGQYYWYPDGPSCSDAACPDLRLSYCVLYGSYCGAYSPDDIRGSASGCVYTWNGNDSSPIYPPIDGEGELWLSSYYLMWEDVWIHTDWDTSIVSVNGVPTGISETESAGECTISQTVLFDQSHPLPISGREIDNRDYRPLGLDPFNNGSFQSSLPISSIVLVYQVKPWIKEQICRDGGCGPDEYLPTVENREYHDVTWQPLGFTSFFTVPTCIEPTISITGCVDADDVTIGAPKLTSVRYPITTDVAEWIRWVGNVLWHGARYLAAWMNHLFAFWFAWLWCRLQALFVFVNSWASYVGCTTQRTLAMAVNSVAEYIYNIYIDVGGQFSDLIWVLTSFFKQVGYFVGSVAVPEISAWLEEMQHCIADQLNSWLPAFTDFLGMAFSELMPWVGDLLTWFVDDFVTATWNQLLTLLSTVVASSSATMTFLTRQFAAMILDLVNMMGFGLRIVVFVTELVMGMIVGLQAALNADTTMDLFTSATFFWRGVELFDELIGETPLVFLNFIAIGFMAIRLIPWTVQYLGLLVLDLMGVIGT